MRIVKQEDKLGCAVACVAFVLEITYQEAQKLFKNGQNRVKSKANFYSPEIVKILKSKDVIYKWEKLRKTTSRITFKEGSIVFIKKAKKYPYGHFLVRYRGKWMDPWINLPEVEIKAGFRKKLPGKPSYVIYQI